MTFIRNPALLDLFCQYMTLNEIEVSEAKLVTALKINDLGITSLSGIEFFINLDIYKTTR